MDRDVTQSPPRLKVSQGEANIRKIKPETLTNYPAPVHCYFPRASNRYSQDNINGLARKEKEGRLENKNDMNQVKGKQNKI